MPTIQKGTARDPGTKFWEICDNTKAVITEFNHNKFSQILSNAVVYFIDLDLDPRLCENVQTAADVDAEIQAASEKVGVDTLAEMVLRDYVMRALMYALGKQGSARTRYLQQLRDKMNAVRSEAEAKGSKVTSTILANNGID